jgi:hypothetical protein
MAGQSQVLATIEAKLNLAMLRRDPGELVIAFKIIFFFSLIKSIYRQSNLN